MATAVEPSTQPTTPKPPANLVFASVIGAVYVVAAVMVAFYVFPTFWRDTFGNEFGSDQLKEYGSRTPFQGLLVYVLWKFGRVLAGANPPKGLSGGIFLMLFAANGIFFVTRWVGFVTEQYEAGKIIAAAVGILLTVLAGKFFLSTRGERWMVGLEEQGWFSSHSYKKALGQKVRRLTILGFLLIGGTGVYSMYYQGLIPSTWVLSLPFELGSLTLMLNGKVGVPVILIGLTLWLAFRVVNMPAFAEFLIATEAEMNKVSWTSKKRLVQDTIVVLITTLLMTVFLLAVDLFWGWLLSRETVGVLPTRAAAGQKAEDKAVDW